MKYASKEALVLTVRNYIPFDRVSYRETPRFVFYIDTDKEKIAFIDWYLERIHLSDELFCGVHLPFDGLICSFPDGSLSLCTMSTM